MTRLINQAKLSSYRTTYQYKFGYKVPKDYDKAKEFDRINKNKFWQTAISLKMFQMKEDDVFINKGKYKPSK